MSKIVETIRMVDGSLKDFNYSSDDFEGIKNYFESRSIDEVVKVVIDGKEYSPAEADKVMLRFEDEHIGKLI